MLLSVLIELLKSLRRTVRRGGRHLSLIADVLAEAREQARRYPFSE